MENILFVCGSDILSREEKVNSLISSLLPEEEKEYSLITLYANESSSTSISQRIISEATTIGMFAEKKVLHIKYAEAMNSSDKSELESFISNPAENSYLIFEAEKIEKRSKFGKLISKKDSKHCQLFVLDLPPDYKMADWIVERTRAKYNRAIAFDAAERLLEKIDPYPLIIDQEIARLCDSSVENSIISLENVNSIVTDSKECNPWDINESLLKRDSQEALRILDSFYRNNLYLPNIVSNIFNLFKQLYLIRIYAEENPQKIQTYITAEKAMKANQNWAANKEIINEVAKDLGVFAQIINSASDRGFYPKVIKSGIIEYARRFDTKQLENLLHYLAEFDYKSKTGQIKQRSKIEMETLILKVIHLDKLPVYSLF